jgi:hypothetical protein
MVYKNSFYIIFGLIFLSGCAVTPNKYETFLNPIIGSGTKEDIIREYGAPHRKEVTDKSEFWLYHFSHGHKRVVTPPQKNPFADYYENPQLKSLFKPTPGKVEEYEIYDEIIIEFGKTGKFKSWKQLH